MILVFRGIHTFQMSDPDFDLVGLGYHGRGVRTSLEPRQPKRET